MTGPKLRQTHTLATMELSELAYQEVKGHLLEAGYDHAIDGELVDMSGIGLLPSKDPVITLYGIKFSMAVLKHLAFGAIGSTFRLVHRTGGQVALEIVPDAPHGYVIDNGRIGAAQRWRYMNVVGLADWTADHDRALRFVRRQDAESFCAQDQDAWGITPYLPSTTDNGDSRMQITISTTGFKAEVLERLKEPGSAGTLAAGEGVAPPNDLELIIRNAIADHLRRYARSDGNVTVTCSLTLDYKRHQDSDGNRQPVPTDTKVS